MMASFLPAMAAAAIVCLQVSLPALSITEIHYAPPAGDEDLQFVEVFNDASSAVDISGWSFSHGIDFVFPEGTVLSGRRTSSCARMPPRSRAATALPTRSATSRAR